MSPTALRWSALPVGLLAFAVRIALRHRETQVIWHDLQDLHVLPPLWVRWHAEYLVVPAAALVYLALGLAQLRPPKTFVRSHDRFVVPASPFTGGLQATFWISVSASAFWFIPDYD